jgi:hypothetical protein
MKSLKKKIEHLTRNLHSTVNYDIHYIINSQIRGKTLFIHLNNLKLWGITRNRVYNEIIKEKNK